MRKLLILSVLFATPAFAQDYTVTLSAQDLAYIGKILGQQPYTDVSTLLTKIIEQINKENQAAAIVPPVPSPVVPDAKSK